MSTVKRIANGGHLKYSISASNWSEKREMCKRLELAFGNAKRHGVDLVRDGEWTWTGSAYSDSAMYVIYLTTEEQAVYATMAFETA